MIWTLIFLETPFQVKPAGEAENDVDKKENSDCESDDHHVIPSFLLFFDFVCLLLVDEGNLYFFGIEEKYEILRILMRILEF